MLKQKIIVLSDISYPDTNAGASRIYERLKYWSESYSVKLVTQKPANGKSDQVSKEQQFSIRRFPRSPFGSKKLISRAIGSVWFSVLSFTYLIFQAKKGDLLFATSPQFSNLIVSCVISIFKRTKLIFEISDLWPDILVEVDFLSKNSFIYKVWVKLELFLYKRADVIIALTPGMKKRIVDKGIDEQKVFTVINGFDQSLWKEKSGCLERKKFVVGYYGTLGRVIDITFFLEVVEACFKSDASANIEFQIAGQGVKEKQVLDFIDVHPDLPVKFLGEVEKENMQNLWNKTDVCFIPLLGIDVMKMCIPAKLIECIGVGVPLILSGPEFSDGSQIINQYNFGESFKIGKTNKVVESILRMSLKGSAYQDILMSMKKNRHLFTRKQQADKVCEALKS